jgi:hypothetical protein
VNHRDDFDFVAADRVDQAERKSGKDVPPSAASMTRPCTRVLGDSLDGVP